MLSEISRHKRINIVWFHLYEVLRLGKYIETESRTVVARGWGRRNRKLFSGYRVLVPKMEKFRMWMVVMVSQQCEWPSCHAIGPYNWGVVKMVSFMLCIATVKQKQKKKPHMRIFNSYHKAVKGFTDGFYAVLSQSCLILCDPVNCSPPGSSVHGDSPGKSLEWVALLSSRRSSQPRDRTQVSCIAVGFFTIWARWFL